MITDVAGVRVGHWTDSAGLTGCTVVLLPLGTVASGEVRGGAPGTREFALLETFMRRPGDVLSRDHLLEHAWDYAYDNRSNVVDVYVRYLREKIDRPFGVESLETVRGVGYRLRKDGGM